MFEYHSSSFLIEVDEEDGGDVDDTIIHIQLHKQVTENFAVNFGMNHRVN